VDAKLSPGQVLFYRVIAELCREPGIERLELLGRDARWKQELATDTVTMRTYELQRRSLRAVVAKMAEMHVLPLVRGALHERPALGSAASRARITFAAARRFFSGTDVTTDERP
jgi:CelD/BcsL family acetyltransferase involved in cellulose biosynthesis